MLTLTRKTDYALIALSHLASQAEHCSSAREIATRYGLPLPLLMNLLKVLAQKGLAKSVRGPRGGYTLAVAPTQITLNDVIRAVEGPSHLVMCVEQADPRQSDGVSHDQADCELMPSCPVRSPIHRVHDRLVEFLQGVTLADLVGNSACCSTLEQPADKLVQVSGP